MSRCLPRWLSRSRVTSARTSSKRDDGLAGERSADFGGPLSFAEGSLGAAAFLAPLRRLLDQPLAGRRIEDHLGDVGRMVPDALEILGDEQEMRAVTDVLRVLHHEGEKRPEHRIVEVVDRLVAAADILR